MEELVLNKAEYQITLFNLGTSGEKHYNKVQEE